MSENKIIPYEQNFFQKLIKKVVNLFKNKKEKIDNTQIKETVSEKQEIMEIYNLIKNEKIDIEKVDVEKLYKIMILLNEEINILNNTVTCKLNKIESQIESIKAIM